MSWVKKKPHRFCHLCGEPMTTVDLRRRVYYDRETGEAILHKVSNWACSSAQGQDSSVLFFDLHDHDGVGELLRKGG